MIYLASRSPRRQELLSQIGVTYELLDVAVDEAIQADECPERYAQRLALEKARAGAQAVPAGQSIPVLAADTCVVIHGQILGKPEDREQGLWMLGQLSDATHEVYTAVCLGQEHFETRLSISRVTFRALSPGEISAYWASGEPADKAGGYAIQGLGGQFVRWLEGSYSGVMGLPLYETAELLQRAGIELLNNQ
ncbi:MAG: Maf family protein [Candidatus Thiodiazotropha sp.]